MKALTVVREQEGIKMKRRFSKLWLFFCLLGSASLGVAQNLPSYYPADFDNIGVVDAVGTRGESLVVGDVFYNVSSETQVHGLRSRKVTLGWIKPGSRIGFTQQGDYIFEIWLLPGDYAAGNKE